MITINMTQMTYQVRGNKIITVSGPFEMETWVIMHRGRTIYVAPLDRYPSRVWPLNYAHGGGAGGVTVGDYLSGS